MIALIIIMIIGLIIIMIISLILIMVGLIIIMIISLILIMVGVGGRSPALRITHDATGARVRPGMARAR